MHLIEQFIQSINFHLRPKAEERIADKVVIRLKLTKHEVDEKSVDQVSLSD